MDAIFCAERCSVIEATTKAGKTVGCIYWIVHEAAKSAGEYWWVAPVYPQTEIAYRRLKGTLQKIDPQGEHFKFHDTRLSASLPNGAVIRFKSGDDADNLYGEDVRAAVIDEASRVKEAAWHAIRSTLTATNGRIRIIGNVRGRKNWAYSLARRTQAGDLPGWKYSKITAADAVAAGIIDAAEVESARRELPAHVFRELYEAEPSDDGGNPFGLQHIAACVCDLGAGPPVAYGVDLAKSVDWTVVVGLNREARPCVFERWQRIPWSETVDRIVGIVGDKPALVDSTGVGDPIVETLQRRGSNFEGFQFTSSSKQKLMEGLSLAIQGHSVGILEGVMRNECESFEYEYKPNGVRYQAAEGMHDDCVVGLALAVEKSRGYVNVGASVVNAIRPPGPRPTLADKQAVPVDVWAERRKNPEWGWEKVR